jgi:hypothetical protein
MKVEQLHQLSRPFPMHLVKEAPSGKFGDYVPHSTVTERLLSIVGPFDFQIMEVIRGYAPPVIGKDGTKESPAFSARANAIVGCIGTLGVTIDGRQVWVSEVGDVDEPAMNHDGSNLKFAASDAIKRCAMRIGLGLHLWSQENYFLDKQLEATLGIVNAEAAVDALDGEIEQATTGDTE